MAISTDPSLDSLTDLSIKRVRDLMDESDKNRQRNEKANRRRVARLFKDPKAIQATITLTDEVMRIQSVKASARIFRRASRMASVVGFGAFNAFGLKVLNLISRLLPGASVALVHQRVRALSKDQILPFEQQQLHRHGRQRRGLVLVRWRAECGRHHVRDARTVECRHHAGIDEDAAGATALQRQ